MTELVELFPVLQETSPALTTSASVSLKRFFNILWRFWNDESPRNCNTLFQTRFDFSSISGVCLFHNRFGLLLKNLLSITAKVKTAGLE